jgi:hypothetical protein
MGYAHRLAVSRGSTVLTTTHLLAAIASHSDGDVLLKGKATAVKGDALALMPPRGGGAGLAAGKQLPSEPALRELIQVATKAALSVPAESDLRCIDLCHYLELMGQMPGCEAFPILSRHGLASRGGAAAG